VGPKEQQTTFTREEQRRGVYIIPLAIPGVFQLFWKPLAHYSTGYRAESSAEAQTAAEQDAVKKTSADAAGYEADEDEAAARVKNSFQFDWAAYHGAFGKKTFEEAVTAICIEYV